MSGSLFQRFENIIVLDLETTGVDARGDEIIELAAVRLQDSPDGPVTAEQFDLLVQLSDGRVLPECIVQLTGITQAQLEAEGVPKQAAAERFVQLLSCERPLLAAYNAQFDLRFLYYFLSRLGLAQALRQARLFDLLTVYRDRRPYPHRLENAVAAYALQTQNTHRAIDDALAAAELLLAMERERDDLTEYINLFGYIPKYGVSGPRISSVRYVPQPYDGACLLYERTRGEGVPV